MSELFAVKHCYLIPLLPLIAAAVSGFFGARLLKGRSHWPIWIGVLISAVLSTGLLCAVATRAGGEHDAHGHPWVSVRWYDWIVAGGSEAKLAHHTADTVGSADGTAHGLQPFVAQAGAWIDSLSAVMLCVVCGIGFLITVFAAGYMKGEAGYFRFFAYLGLFIFAMTCLVMGNNFIMLYLGWEGVGLCSYLLIGYYYEKPAAREAAKKAFLVNRIGDFGFGLGIMLIYLAFGTVSYFGDGPGTMSGVLDMAATPRGLMSPFQVTAMQWIPFLLMLGAFGKSAQFPLYVWLPDAMEGPTPVSALIHAATMVTAGVYMIARCGTLFVGNVAATWTVAIVGAFTAIFAASIALRQFDLKKVFAYSTISQLGFMFVGVGVLAPVAGVFHLVTHAFFKALLFLSSGVVMHAMAGELDMRKFSGLKRVLPKTRWLMLIGCAALAGLPFLSGFFSKDEIVAAAWSHSRLLGMVLLLTAFMTAYYTFRLYFRVFEGPEVLPEAPAHGHGHGSHDAQDAHGHAQHNHEPAIMILPLVLLAVGAILAGYLNWPKEHLGQLLGTSPSFTLALQKAQQVYPLGAVAPVPFGTEEVPDAAIIAHERSLHLTMMIVSGLIAILGIYLAYLMHLKDRAAADRAAARFPSLVRLLEGKYWVDEVYQAGIVEPLRAVGRAFFLFDRFVVDGVVWMIGFVPQASGFVLKITTQRGYLQGYAATMLFGVVIILVIVFW